MTNNGFAYVFQEGRLSTSTTDLEHNKYLGQISTNMRLASSRDGDLISQFDNINEEIDADEPATSNNIRITSLNKMLITNLEENANRGNIKGQLFLEHIFGFCKTFEMVTKNLGFRITFKTANLQDIIYTTIADATPINVTINSLYLFVLFLMPTTETQLMFNESTQNNYRILFDEWYTERRILADQIFQVDIGSAQSVNSPTYMICTHQTEARSALPHKRNNISITDNINVGKYFIKIDGERYPRDSVLTNYGENDYIDQYRNLKIFYKEYIGEELLIPFVSYTDMKNKYPIQVIDLRFQADHITPKKINCLKKPKQHQLKLDYMLY